MTTARRILVTGANGFIGRAVVRRLIGDGISVTAAVRRDVDFGNDVRVCRVGDIDPNTEWGPAVDGCDAVVHLAARVHQIRDRSPDPLAEYRRVNRDGTVRLARLAAAAGVARFVFISSIKVNGESTRPGSPFTEADNPNPSDAYGVSKAEAESGVRAVCASTAMSLTIIRPPLVYGPGVRANFLAMTRWVARGLPLPLGAVTDNRRSLVALDNLVSLIGTCTEHPAAANETFLVSDGEDLSTAELLRKTAVALGVAPRLIPVPVALLRGGAVFAFARASITDRLLGSLQVDASKARRVLGWTPVVSVDEGLRRAVQVTEA